MTSEKWDDLVKVGLEVKKPAEGLEMIASLRNLELKFGFIGDEIDNLLIGNCGYYIACTPKRLEELFSTTLRIYEKDGKKCYELVTPAIIPSNLEEYISRIKIINDLEIC